ncbi:RNA polymerase sigma factor [Actinopolymorpha pittospori]|uniref:DNA-directed RNA polymerase specialized sigma24 family protein n=1 Tax=Actinopolymorpha pittospori TaxID=648752 RepID=A0A927NBY7_9ACTN|nr:hypothetical protein [Actinopolymorpha pittospori]MBE1612717.1 DNA-directed RNA polymerase specialized sigma24 family protein [Actinopolymorpha pittospori]
MTATPRDPSHRDAEDPFVDGRGDRSAPVEGSADADPTTVDEAAVDDAASDETASDKTDADAVPAESATNDDTEDTITVGADESTRFDLTAVPPPSRPGPPDRPLPPADADLIAATRIGDDDAYDELLRRHETAGQRLVSRLTSDSDQAEVVVRDAADRGLATLRSGSGPDLAFRAFLLRTILGRPTTRGWPVGHDPTSDEIEFRLAQALRGIDSAAHTAPTSKGTPDPVEDAARSAEDAPTVPGFEPPDTLLDVPAASADAPTLPAFEPATLVDLPRDAPGEVPAASADAPTLPAFEPATVLPPDDPVFDLVATEAFGVLPEPWQAALWHIEVEGDHPDHVGVLLGMSAADVAVASARARAAFRQYYARQHLDASWPPLCQDVIDRLSRFTFAGLYDDEAGQVAAHLQTCTACTALTQRLEDVDDDLPLVLAATVLGEHAAAYLEAVRQPPQDFAPLTPAARAEADGPPGAQAPPWPTRFAELGRRTWTERHVWLRRRSTGIAALGTLAAASVVILAWATVAVLTGGGVVPAGDERPATPGRGGGGPVVEEPDTQSGVTDEATPEEFGVLPATVAPSPTDLPSTDFTVGPTRESSDDEAPERGNHPRPPDPTHSTPGRSPSHTPTSPPHTPTSTPTPTPTDTEEPSPSQTPSPPEEPPTTPPTSPPPDPNPPTSSPTPREQTSTPPTTPPSSPPATPAP